MRKPANLFVGFKTGGAIPVAFGLRRDFLIQTTLDAGVRGIHYHQTAMVLDKPVRIDALLLDRNDGRFAVDFVDARPAADPDGEALLQFAFEQKCSGLIAVGEADVRREPRFTSARMVWRHAAIRVGALDRAQIVDTLEAEGPIPFRSLEGLVNTSRDLAEVVYALACEGSVALDLRMPLDDRTLVRVGVTTSPRTDRLRLSA